MRKSKKLFSVYLLVLFCVFWYSVVPKVDNSVTLRLESFAINLSPLKIADTESMQVASLLYSLL